jgi:integrase
MIDDFDILQATMADSLHAWLSPMSRDERRYALAVAEMLTTQITPDAGVDRAKRAALRALSEAKKSLSPDLAAPMKYAAKDINRLVEQIRSGQPPELPKCTREKHYRDPALPGLYIRLLNTGVASWSVQWKRLGRQKKITLGDVLVLDRQDAIKAAKDLLAKVQLRTLDPHEAKRERMRANKVTFATVIPLFLEHKIRQGDLRPGTVKYWKRDLTGYYFQPLHNLPIDEITSDQIQTRIDYIAIQSGNAPAEHCVMIMRVFFKWARKTGKLPADHRNPMDNVQAPKTNGPRDRVLEDDEIRLIWKSSEAWEAEVIHAQQIKASTGKWPRSGGIPITDFSRATMLLFLTGCRAQEIGDLRWGEINLDDGELIIPATRTKNAEELCVPLADWAVKILHRIKQEQQPDKDHVFGHTNRGGQFLSNINQKIKKRIAKAGGAPLKHWTIHDIRRTFRTKMAQLGVPADVAEALVGHVGHRTQMDRIYNRYKYWPEKRQAIAKLEAHLRAIIDGTAEKIVYQDFGEQAKGGTT